MNKGRKVLNVLNVTRSMVVLGYTNLSDRRNVNNDYDDYMVNKLQTTPNTDFYLYNCQTPFK